MVEGIKRVLIKIIFIIELYTGQKLFFTPFKLNFPLIVLDLTGSKTNLLFLN